MQYFLLLICCVVSSSFACEAPYEHTEPLTPIVAVADAAPFAGLLVAYHQYPYDQLPALAPFVGPLGEQLSVGWVSTKPKLLEGFNRELEEAYCMKKLLDSHSWYGQSTYLALRQNLLENTRIEIRRLTQEEQRYVIGLVGSGKAHFDPTAYPEN